MNTLNNLVATIPGPISTAANDLDDFWTGVAVVLMITIGLSVLAWRLLKRGARSA